MASETYNQRSRMAPKAQFKGSAETIGSGGELMALRGVTRHFRTRRHSTLAIDRISLAVEPRMLLMDEPFAALDAQTRDVLQQELQEITARLRTTVIFVTHNVRE